MKVNPINLTTAILFVLFLLVVNGLPAQQSLQLRNPSFEDTPHTSRVPKGWLNGGFTGESPPDIAPTGFFREDTAPSDGKSYLAMVTRDAGTWERVANELPNPLRAGQCYSWEIDLARSATYFSPSRISGQMINFNEPVVLRIWGGRVASAPLELLAVSPLIEHEQWQRYRFSFRPEKEHPLLILEVMYQLNTTKPYAGNLLLDNASALQLEEECVTQIQDLTAWNNWLPPLQGSTAEEPPAMSLDTEQVKYQLEELAAGHIDIGLYEIANIGRQVKATDLLLTVKENPEEAPLLKVKLFRSRLKAMEVSDGLKVSKKHSEKKYPHLLAESENGLLQVWGSGE